MVAGPALDTLVAEEAMGLARIGRGHVPLPEGKFVPLPNYSTDIAAALSLKDRMVEDGFRFSLFESRTGAIRVSFICPSGPCEKHGSFQHNHHGAYDVEAETASLAICVAALKAIGIVSLMDPRRRDYCGQVKCSSCETRINPEYSNGAMKLQCGLCEERS